MILEPPYYSSHTTLVYGDLGFINFVDNKRLAQESNATVVGDESNGAVAEEESNGAVAEDGAKVH